MKLWVIAFRGLGRNRRRTGLTMLAVTLGLAVLIMMAGFEMPVKAMRTQIASAVDLVEDYVSRQLPEGVA